MACAPSQSVPLHLGLRFRMLTAAPDFPEHKKDGQRHFRHRRWPMCWKPPSLSSRP